MPKVSAKIKYALIGLGIVFWLPSMLNYSVSLSQVALPGLLIGIGVLVITRRSGTPKNHVDVSNGNNHEASNYLNDTSILGGGTKIIQSKDFKGGDITAIFGGSEFSFRDAEIITNNCTIDVFTMFGGSKLIVPDNWVVKSDMLSIFGGFNDKRAIRLDEGEQTKVLYLTGVVVFGGIEIKSY